MKNLALAAHKVEANYDQTQFPGAHATDGRHDTRWTVPKGGHATSGDTPPQLTVDLGQVRTVDAVEVKFEYPERYQLYQVEVSRDGKNWDTPIDFYTYSLAEAYAIRYQTGPYTGRFFRLTVSPHTERRSVSVWEFCLWQRIDGLE